MSNNTKTLVDSPFKNRIGELDNMIKELYRVYPNASTREKNSVMRAIYLAREERLYILKNYI